jgi:hypothetical protein
MVWLLACQEKRNKNGNEEKSFPHLI